MARGLGTRARFAVAYLLLGAAVGGGIGTTIVLLQRPGPQPPPPWSSWRPAAGPVGSRLLEIAEHVGSGYHLRTGDQLAAVKVGGQQASGTDFQGVAILKKGSAQTVDQQYGTSDTAFYILCGATGTCALDQGDPAEPRGALLRREALELALYTLEYAHPIDNVLVFFPPAPGQKALTTTLFFRRDDLSSSLRSPLRKTLLQARAPVPGRIVPREKAIVDDLTATKLYRYLGLSQNLVVLQPNAGLGA